jgi:hypothetical protein
MMDAPGEEERHPIGIYPFRFSDPSVARRGQALVWLNHQLDTVSERPQSIGQAVGRAIVDDHDLQSGYVCANADWIAFPANWAALKDGMIAASAGTRCMVTKL